MLFWNNKYNDIEIYIIVKLVLGHFKNSKSSASLEFDFRYDIPASKMIYRLFYVSFVLHFWQENMAEWCYIHGKEYGQQNYLN